MAEAEGRARLLADLAWALTAASEDLQRVLDTAAESAASLVGDGAVLRLADAAGLLIDTAVYHADAQMAAAIRGIVDVPDQRASDGISGAVSGSGRLFVDNAVTFERLQQANPARSHAFIAQLKIRAMIIAPLAVDGRYLGFLALVRHTGTYGPDDEQLTTDIAARVALAVATAQMIQRLRAEEQNYRQIVETSLDGIVKTDSVGVTTFVNDRMAQILAMTPEQMIGQNAAQWIVDSDDSAGRLAARQAGQNERYETRLRRDDGSTVWVHVTAAPILDERGVVSGMLGMVSDISDRKRNEELSRRLEQMQRLDSLGQLAGGIAHDFNNLLAIIGGYADMWRDDLPDGTPERDAADHISAAVDRGAALTRQLLAFGRGQPSNAEVMDVQDVITALAPMLRRTIGEHIELTTATDSTAPVLVRIDRGQLEQVVVNLAVNATDAMPGGGRLSIDCDRILLDNAELGEDVTDGSDKTWFVRLAVSDTGQGMDRETLAHAFEPFYTTKGVGHGTGLGLAGVYGIVRNAGGLARLYSEVGHGTTVKIYLPMCDDNPAQTAVLEPARTETVTDVRIQTHDVLVVEDSPELAAVVKRLLTREGFRVTVCTEPVHALTTLLDNLHVDLVITDVVMPNMTGPELARAIHRHHPDLPILYTSGYTAGVLGDRVQLDPDAILVEKPFSRTTLLDAINRALRQR